MSANTNPGQTATSRTYSHSRNGSLSFQREDLQCMQMNLLRGEERLAYAQLHKSSDKTLEVVDLFVEPEHRGNGYGKTLLQEVLDYARSSGYDQVCAHTSPDNGPAYRLFRGLGFHACETEVHLELDL